MHYHELHLWVPTKGCFLIQEHDFLCNKDSQTDTLSPRDPLRTRTQHCKLHLGLQPALHHHRQRTAAAGWDSKSGWLWDCWCLNVMVGRDGTIMFTLRERMTVSVKAGADLIYSFCKTVNGGFLFEQMCSLCVTSTDRKCSNTSRKLIKHTRQIQFFSYL